MSRTEVVIAVASVACLVAIVAALLTGLQSARTDAQEVRDSVQIRNIHGALSAWAESNQGRFPLPSLVDTADTTVSTRGAAKNTTANLFSMLIFDGALAPEQFISPAEANSRVQVDSDYAFINPPAAVDPQRALWDPAFAADFSGGRIGNSSYAHVIPGGGREKLWARTFSLTEPLVGNRGPEVKSLARATREKASVVYALANSNTFLIHGSRSAWEGMIVYNDGHVQFETSTMPKTTTYTTAGGLTYVDCLFFDEPEDANGTNAWMSIWTTAGDGKKDFTPIWD